MVVTISKPVNQVSKSFLSTFCDSQDKDGKDESNTPSWWRISFTKFRMTVAQNGLSEYHMNQLPRQSYLELSNKYVWEGV